MKTHVLLITILLLSTMAIYSKAGNPMAPDSSMSYEKIEIKPEYPGGHNAMVEFIASNVKYPELAKKNGVEGKVFVAFEIKKDGSVQNVKILRGVSKECDAEALRVIRSMPKWKPGSDGKKNVDVKLSIPIQFKLSKEK